MMASSYNVAKSVPPAPFTLSLLAHCRVADVPRQRMAHHHNSQRMLISWDCWWDGFVFEFLRVVPGIHCSFAIWHNCRCFIALDWRFGATSLYRQFFRLQARYNQEPDRDESFGARNSGTEVVHEHIGVHARWRLPAFWCCVH